MLRRCSSVVPRYIVALPLVGSVNRLSQPLPRDRTQPAPAMKWHTIERNFKLDRHMEILFVAFDLATGARIDHPFGPVEDHLALPANRGVGGVFFRDHSRCLARAGERAPLVD